MTLQHPRPVSALRQLLSSEASGGILLMVAAAAALIVANSTLAPAYFDGLNAKVAGLSVLHWINDGLMAVFFLLVGLEIKRELIEGQLSKWEDRVLPGVAALGGMLIPALAYLLINGVSAPTTRGWAIPTATDIAFALGAMALLGKRVPVSLKIFLTALAILDDLGAITIIALVYTDNLHIESLFLAGAVLAMLIGLRITGWLSLSPYLILGCALWFFTLKSGVHATLAGVILAFMIPLPPKEDGPADDRPLLVLEHAIQPWVAFLVVPTFGFANAGVSFAGMGSSALLAPVTLGIAAGLFFGKQAGVFLATWAAVALKLSNPPAGASWPQVYGVSLLCGIGFTMSLFIGLLAFPTDEALQSQVKLGVLLGSIASGAVGMAVLALSKPKERIPVVAA